MNNFTTKNLCMGKGCEGYRELSVWGDEGQQEITPVPQESSGSHQQCPSLVREIATTAAPVIPWFGPSGHPNPCA